MFPLSSEVVPSPEVVSPSAPGVVLSPSAPGLSSSPGVVLSSSGVVLSPPSDGGGTTGSNWFDTIILSVLESVWIIDPSFWFSIALSFCTVKVYVTCSPEPFVGSTTSCGITTVKDPTEGTFSVLEFSSERLSCIVVVSDLWVSHDNVISSPGTAVYFDALKELISGGSELNGSSDWPCFKIVIIISFSVCWFDELVLLFSATNVIVFVVIFSSGPNETSDSEIGKVKVPIRGRSLYVGIFFIKTLSAFTTSQFKLIDPLTINGFGEPKNVWITGAPPLKPIS